MDLEGAPAPNAAGASPVSAVPEFDSSSEEIPATEPSVRNPNEGSRPEAPVEEAAFEPEVENPENDPATDDDTPPGEASSDAEEDAPAPSEEGLEEPEDEEAPPNRGRGDRRSSNNRAAVGRSGRSRGGGDSNRPGGRGGSQRQRAEPASIDQAIEEARQIRENLQGVLEDLEAMIVLLERVREERNGDEQTIETLRRELRSFQSTYRPGGERRRRRRSAAVKGRA